MTKNACIKTSLVIAISSIMISNIAIAQEDKNNTVIDNSNESVSEIINPFKSLNPNLEEIMMQKKIAEEKLDLIDSQIELEKRNFEREMLPYQQEIQRQQLSSQLYQTQKTASPEPETPQTQSYKSEYEKTIRPHPRSRNSKKHCRSLCSSKNFPFNTLHFF
jgi:hypothetical protein